MKYKLCTHQRECVGTKNSFFTEEQVSRNLCIEAIRAQNCLCVVLGRTGIQMPALGAYIYLCIDIFTSQANKTDANKNIENFEL